MLDELMSCIETLRERMKIHKEVLSANETRTRTQLIEPLLSALGWDVADPASVTPEYNPTGRIRADYALRNPEGDVMMVLEAKNLGNQLDAHDQMLVYAVGKGIKYAGLTDGDRWELYDVFKQVPMDQKQLLDVSVARDPIHEVAMRMLLLWQPNLASGSPISTPEPIIQPQPPKPDPPPPDPPPPDPPPDSELVSLGDYAPAPYTPPPLSVIYWDKEQRKLESWYELLTFTVEKMYSDGLIKYEDLPIESRHNTYAITKTPRARNGAKFTFYEKIGDPPIYVNTNLNAGQIRFRTKVVLQKFGKAPSEVLLAVSNETDDENGAS